MRYSDRYGTHFDDDEVSEGGNASVSHTHDLTTLGKVIGGGFPVELRLVGSAGIMRYAIRPATAGALSINPNKYEETAYHVTRDDFILTWQCSHV